MFDLKPLAPAEIRGEFRPIATSVPGLQICEHLPRTARLMHKVCLIRSVTHAYNAHNPLPIMTGFTGGIAGSGHDAQGRGSTARRSTGRAYRPIP